jgi:GNAT superfamily N-acetyltransferase
MTTIETRRATVDDAASMARLAMELGYDCEETSMRRRLIAIRSEADHAIFVAGIEGGDLVGWVHVEIRRGLLMDHYAEMSGLVVSRGHRRLGVGRALLDRATSWAYQLDFDRLRVRCQLHRESAIAFYEKVGFKRSKDQRVFDRLRSDPDVPKPVITLVDR